MPLQGARRGRLKWIAAWLFLLYVWSPAMAASQPVPASTPSQAESAGGTVTLRGRGSEECSRLPPSVWPSGSISRRLHIARLQLARASCIDNADYLSALGGLILEDGDAEQALIWLERALLLDPDNRGAQADHALALAALGQPEALAALSRSWLGRSDIPPALRDKLFPVEPRSAYAFPPVRLGQVSEINWGTQGEVSVVLGYETNLDRSPRLTELTLTPVDDDPTLVTLDRRPRPGAAAISSGAFQFAYAPVRSTILRAGLSLTDRSARKWHNTDWQQVQSAASVAHQWSQLRGQIEIGASWIGGPLSEAFRLNRAAASLDVPLKECRTRVTYEVEHRKQSRTAIFNSSAEGGLASLQCALPFAPTWSATVFFRTATDRPDSAGPEGRPGGIQRVQGQGLRLVGTLDGGLRLDAAFRGSQVRDATPYSALLANIVRRVDLRQFLFELSQPLDRWGWAGVEMNVQYQSASQSSNLALFAFRADSWYGGLRWAW
jgi:hypothetical protein